MNEIAAERSRDSPITSIKQNYLNLFYLFFDRPLVTVAVVIDVTRRLGLRLRTQLNRVRRFGRRSRLWLGWRRILRGNGL